MYSPGMTSHQKSRKNTAFLLFSFFYLNKNPYIYSIPNKEINLKYIMQKQKIITIIFIGFLIAFSARIEAQEFGKFTRADAEYNEYLPDKSVSAVVLYDIGKSRFQRNEDAFYGFELVFERITRIKVLSEEGIAWANVEIPIYQEGSDAEMVYDLEAYTYNYVNGTWYPTPLDNNTSYDEKIDEYWYARKFKMPDVKVGSIIEVRYQVLSQYIFNLRDWEFQREIPTLYSKYEVKMIPFFEYTYLLQGRRSFDYENSYIEIGIPRKFGIVTYKELVHEYAMSDVPPFKNEIYSSSRNDLITKIDFQLSKMNKVDGSSMDYLVTWPKIVKDLGKHQKFGKYLRKSEKSASKILNSDHQLPESSRDKFDYILHYVKENYTWNKFDGIYITKSVSNLTSEKTGNVADINLFTVGMLKAAGIEAFPVVSSTRGHGTIKYEYPYVSFFNYVVIAALIDGEYILADATEAMNSNNQLPPRCNNNKGLLIYDGDVKWLELEGDNSSQLDISMSIAINNSIVEAHVIEKAYEYEALLYRNKYSEDKEIVLSSLNEKEYEVKIASIDIKNYSNIEEPYVLEYDVEFSEAIKGDKIVISPFLNEVIDFNPFTERSRKNPIDMIHPIIRNYETVITIPDGYELESLPDQYEMSNSRADIFYTHQQIGNQVLVSFSYHFKQAIYSAKDYDKLKFYYNDIVRKGKDKIVLVKK